MQWIGPAIQASLEIAEQVMAKANSFPSQLEDQAQDAISPSVLCPRQPDSINGMIIWNDQKVLAFAGIIRNSFLRFQRNEAICHLKVKKVHSLRIPPFSWNLRLWQAHLRISDSCNLRISKICVNWTNNQKSSKPQRDISELINRWHALLARMGRGSQRVRSPRKGPLREIVVAVQFASKTNLVVVAVQFASKSRTIGILNKFVCTSGNPLYKMCGTTRIPI